MKTLQEVLELIEECTESEFYAPARNGWPEALRILEVTVRERDRCEMLLRRIQNARTAFSLDTGGPSTPLEGLMIIEGWIEDYFSNNAR